MADVQQLLIISCLEQCVRNIAQASFQVALFAVSSIFDSVDHSILLHCHSSSYGSTFESVDYSILLLYLFCSFDSIFDLVGNSILLQCLSSSFDLVDQCHKWFRSFLSDRSDSVVLSINQSIIIRLMTSISS